MSNSSEKDLHKEHRKRVRANVSKNGFSQLEDHQLLELLLFYTIPRADTNETAHRLLKEFGSLSGVIKASSKSLTDIKDVGPESALYLNALGELTSRIFKQAKITKKFNNQEDIKEIVLSHYVDEPKEKILVLGFNEAMRFNFAEFIAEGDMSTADLDLNKLIKKIIYSDSSVVVLAHNHPNGITEPSHADVDATGVIAVMLRKLNIVLFDHMIVTDDSVYSMREDIRCTKIFDDK